MEFTQNGLDGRISHIEALGNLAGSVMKGAQDDFGVVEAVGLGFDVPERVSLETDVVGAHFEDLQKIIGVARAAAVL